MEDLEIRLKKEFKEKEEAMNLQFSNDLEHLHKEQKREIEILCQRISSLKNQLAELQDQHKAQFWKHRDYKMSLHYQT